MLSKLMLRVKVSWAFTENGVPLFRTDIMEGQFEILPELIVQLSHEPLSVPERNCSAFFSPVAQAKLS